MLKAFNRLLTRNNMAFFSGLNTWKRLIPALFVYVCHPLQINSELFPKKLSWVFAYCIENHNF